jgi:hypothetical protein
MLAAVASLARLGPSIGMREMIRGTYKRDLQEALGLWSNLLQAIIMSDMLPGHE